MPSKDLKNIYISSGVNPRGKAFCTVSINGGDLLGQLSPGEVRDMALQWLAAAEAAESDSIVFRMLTEDIELPAGNALPFIEKMRERRS